MNMIEEAITFHWGERCEEYVQGCPVCDAWRQYDDLSDACVEVKPLQWEDFDGMGAKASALLIASYLIVKWSDGDFRIEVSAPGYSTSFDGPHIHTNLEAAKAAAQADYEHRIRSALTLRTVEDVRTGGYMQGYSDAEAEISKTVLYQELVSMGEMYRKACRTVEDVRREGYEQGYRDGFKKSGWSEMERQTKLIDSPAPSRETQPCEVCKLTGYTDAVIDDRCGRCSQTGIEPHQQPDELRQAKAEAWERARAPVDVSEAFEALRQRVAELEASEHGLLGRLETCKKDVEKAEAKLAEAVDYLEREAQYYVSDPGRHGAFKEAAAKLRSPASPTDTDT